MHVIIQEFGINGSTVFIKDVNEKGQTVKKQKRTKIY
jgi:hypothetical protein